MSFEATTPAALRIAYATEILAITPTHDRFAEYAWSEIEDQDPQGAAPRTFRVLTGPALIVGAEDGGMYCGDLVELQMELRVRVSYDRLIGNELTDLITQDGLDLWAAFHDKPGGSAASITGLLSYGGDTFEPEPAGQNSEEANSETESRMVDFVYTVRFCSRI